jgi:putative peptide zinc metalloprotease protein
MDPDPVATERERRKQVRLCLRRDLALTPQSYEGCAHWVLKDPVSLRYFRFDEYDSFLLRLFDGGHSLEEVRREFEQYFRPRQLSLEDLEGFARVLLRCGLVYHELPQAGQQLYEYRRERRRLEWLQRLTNLLYIEIPLFDPDLALRRLVGWLRWLFTPWFLAAGAAFVLGAVFLVAAHFPSYWNHLPPAREFFSLRNLPSLVMALGLVKICHEFGHGICCKAMGGEVHDMGALLMCLTPCLYLNVSDAWTLPDKWKRILVGFAGVYTELLIAAAATIVWWYAPGEAWLRHLCLNLVFVCGVSTVLVNGNPLLRFDGYYMLADWLEIPNLRERCNRCLKHAVMRYALGIDVPPEPPMARPRRALFVGYAVASYLYSWFITLSVLWVVSRFLQPYKLGAVSMLLAAVSVASMLGWPLYRLLRGLYKRGRLPDMKRGRVAVSLALAAAAVLLVLLVPLPVSRIRQTGLVEVRPGAEENVFVRLTGTLERLPVRSGEEVAQGQVLAEFRSLELEQQLEEARCQHAIRVAEVRALQREIRLARKAEDRARIDVALARADGECEVLARQVAMHEKAMRCLVLQAPRPGVVLRAPRPEEIGKLWEKDQETPVCSLGDPRRLRVLVPVPPPDYRLLQEQRRDGDVPVTIGVEGWDGRTWRGRVACLPETEAREVPLALTARAGGPLAVRPGPRPNSYVPQTQQYLVAVDFVDPEAGVWPGARAHVKIHCRWRPLGWWLWRKIAIAFDLGLM